MTRKFGEIMVDHRASPGIPAEQARRLGYDPSQVKEGALFEAATMTCCGCGRVVVKNPLRTRERFHCFQCNSYICDFCEVVRREGRHVPFKAVVDLMQSGKVTRGSIPIPLLIPKEGSNG